MTSPPPSPGQTRRLARAQQLRIEPRERQKQVLDPFLDRASVQVEWAVSWGRITVAFLAFVRVFVFFFDRLRQGEVKTYIVLIGTVVAMALSGVVLTRLRPEGVRRELFVWSAMLDVALGLVILMPLIIWPHADYNGALREPDHALFYLIAMGAGLRLSDRALIAGIGGSGLSLAAVIAVDHLLHPALVGYPVGDIALVALFFLGVATLSAGFSRFTRRMVRDGSLAALDAERARQTLGVYVNETVARNLYADTQPSLGGTRRPVSVLFSDLRGFTSYSEKRPPEALIHELNDYLDDMVQVIHAEGGLVDKYIGDAIMAVFGLDPSDARDPAVGALRCAQAMQERLVLHNQTRADNGLAPLRQGIGVHHGPAVAGNIGTVERMQYTVLGDTVNTASRLESATKEQQTSVLVSVDVVEAAQRAVDRRDLPRVEEHGVLDLRGREQPLVVYRLG